MKVIDWGNIDMDKETLEKINETIEKEFENGKFINEKEPKQNEKTGLFFKLIMLMFVILVFMKLVVLIRSWM